MRPDAPDHSSCESHSNHTTRTHDQAQKLGKNQLELVDAGTSSSKYVKLEHLGELVSKNLNRALDALADKFGDDVVRRASQGDARHATLSGQWKRGSRDTDRPDAEREGDEGR